MRSRLFFLGVLAFLTCGGRSQERLQPGQEGKLEVPSCKYPCVLYVPTDWQPGAKLPLIFFMHGAGGRPTTWPWRQATEGHGYLLCGLSYGTHEDGAANGIHSDPETRRAMAKFIDDVRAMIDERYGVDDRHVFLTGLSMGGWGVNFYGFLAEARGRYRGYAILAAGLAQGGAPLDLSVLEGKPLLLLNGEKDQNLPAAQRGKPVFEEEGAKVTYVVIPGEGHVPKVDTMTAPLAKWLAVIAREDEVANGMVAVDFRPGELEGTVGDGDEALLEYLKAQAFLAKGSKPVLVFCTTDHVDRHGKPSKQAKDSADVEVELFRYPEAFETPAMAHFYDCYRVDVSKLTKAANPLVHQDTAPLVLLLDRERTRAALFAKAKLQDGKLAAELRTLLDTGELVDADARLERTKPLLLELEKLMKAIASEEKTLAKLRARPSRSSMKSIEKHGEELEALRKRLHELREDLR
ncbi:MAG: hypothetical protein H6834_06680 [Planctomycetes bacterium]|nr:hypothetical protein [Planctomycetota bacterium]MCB9891797.1 hypothetical protein [Planctomycetota bacterium]